MLYMIIKYLFYITVSCTFFLMLLRHLGWSWGELGMVEQVRILPVEINVIIIFIIQIFTIRAVLGNGLGMDMYREKCIRHFKIKSPLISHPSYLLEWVFLSHSHTRSVMIALTSFLQMEDRKIQMYNMNQWKCAGMLTRISQVQFSLFSG